MEIILTHENADFDATAGLLAASKLYPDAIPVIPERINQNVARFVELHHEALPFVQQQAVRSRSVTQVIVVDTQRSVQIKGIGSTTAVHIIDHHPLARELQANHTFESEPVGAVTTLLVERLRERGISLTRLEATLLALGIYEDTGAMTYGTTTPRDLASVSWLLEQGAELDTVRSFLSPPLNQEQQDLLDRLVAGTESRVIEGYAVVVSGVTIDLYVSEISSVTHRLRDLLDPAALFVLVQMPNSLQLVARSTEDAINVGEIARLLGGGGHGRAAAATVHDRTISECTAFLWNELSRQIRPITQVADLMSYGVQTVEANQPLGRVVRQLRRIGHEGFPVVDAKGVVGLLTRRDLDRALEHGLNDVIIRDVMLSGVVTVHPEDSVSTLEQRVVESGWGQIPVVDATDHLIGIVTRTDLIKYWTQRYPQVVIPEKVVSQHQVATVLGDASAKLIQVVAEYAQKAGVKVYMVGGVVRDLLLYRSNLDIDFVVEGNAIELAKQLGGHFGGKVSSFQPFGTARWGVNNEVAERIGALLTELPDTVDFASARNEFYEHPTALPTVYNSSIKLDLQRRDFTINTMAVQLSPAVDFGKVLDFYGGLRDLQGGIIRVLHSLSFIDDPTRILRAVRFKQRLGFSIEARTAELITSAKPMLGRITGERLRNELTLLLREVQPEQGLQELRMRGVLEAIHATFQLTDGFEKGFKAARGADKPWEIRPYDVAELYWHILILYVPDDACKSLCERLMIGRTMMESMLDARRLLEHSGELSRAKIVASRAVEMLDGISELGLLAVWYVSDNRKVRTTIRNYWTDWKHIQISIDGHRLREMGVKPGPCYSVILKRLRVARLNGEVVDEEGELGLVHKLIEDEKVCDD